ncbi:hypothetical protein CesoFtcFv8_019605 [Champsocephalus esox]|uniref:NADH dehydrogenase [ubiquinone] iron-sulfur protein 5 n=2 Tax=Champsocephalus TaxID=52236 RepID=A0AAN8CZL7_CHAGU|nr:hypothetical protein CesoFtcFv8_019605 [Champsocephalus esox]KAK5910863.1 hypothetical protein CgunFtcFv8_005088 [Champsocephalus gunnari]
MPFVDLQTRLGIDADKWLLNQSSLQPRQNAARCHAFEKDWIECSHNIGQTRSKKECQLELEDFNECLHKKKTSKRLYAIRQQRDKMIKEGTYTPPPCHSGQANPSP